MTFERNCRYKYDENGRVLSQSINDLEYPEYTSDGMGDVLTEIKYDAQGAVVYKYEKTYDQYSNPLTFAFYGDDGVNDGKVEYTYEDDDCKMISTMYTGDRVNGKTEGVFENAIYGKKKDK